MVVFCCLIYNYKNRSKEIKQSNKWLIYSPYHQYHHQQQTFHWILLKEANLYKLVFIHSWTRLDLDTALSVYIFL